MVHLTICIPMFNVHTESLTLSDNITRFITCAIQLLSRLEVRKQVYLTVPWSVLLIGWSHPVWLWEHPLVVDCQVCYWNAHSNPREYRGLESFEQFRPHKGRPFLTNAFNQVPFFYPIFSSLMYNGLNVGNFMLTLHNRWSGNIHTGENPQVL